MIDLEEGNGKRREQADGLLDVNLGVQWKRSSTGHGGEVIERSVAIETCRV